VQPVGRVSEQIAVLMHGAALNRDVGPECSERFLEARCSVDNGEFGAYCDMIVWPQRVDTTRTQHLLSTEAQMPSIPDSLAPISFPAWNEARKQDAQGLLLALLFSTSREGRQRRQDQEPGIQSAF